MAENLKLRQWRSRLDESKAMLKQFEDEFEKNYKGVYGADWLKDGKRSDSTNLVGESDIRKYKYDKLLAFIKTEIPSLILYRPEIFITATEQAIKDNPNAEADAKAQQDEINKILNDMDSFEFEVKPCIADSHCAFGVIKVLKEPIIGINPLIDQITPLKDLDEDTRTLINYSLQGKNTKGMIIGMIGNELIIEPEEVITGYKYDIQRVDPFKFRIDHRCKNDPFKAKWKGEEVTKPLDELVASGLYKESVLDAIREKSGHKNKEDWEIEVTFTEVWDNVHGKIIAIPEDSVIDEDMRYDDIPPGIKSDPYAILKFTEIPGQFIPKAEISSGRQFQDDEKDVREWMKTQAKRSVPKLGINERLAEDKTERNKLEDGISHTVICNQNEIFPINNDLKLGSAVGDYATVMQKDFDEVMGQPSQDRGLVGEARFATEAQIAETQGNVREQDKLNTVRVWFETIVEKLIFLKNDTTKELDVNLEIDIESKTPKNKAIERKQFAEVLGIIVENPIFMKCPTLLDGILRDYDIRNRQKVIEELQKAIEANQPKEQPNVPRLGVNIAFKGEYLPKPVADKILDIAFNTNIPMNTGGNGGAKPATAESIGAGTEGMSPGSGMMPTGEVME